MKIDLSAMPKQQYSAAELSGLFGGQQPIGSMTIVQLTLTSLVAYPNQPFRPYSEEKLERLAADIAVNGVLSPIIVRPKGSVYEVLAGHNRWNASRKAGLTTIPSIVQDVEDDIAALIMVNTNLNQRDELAPSEKAFAYKVQMDVMKRQGQRTDLTSRQVVGKLEAADGIGKETGESGRQIQRYIRLTCLVPELLAMVDSGELSMTPGVDLSYLSPEQQRVVLEVSAECDRKISVFQSGQLKKASAEGYLGEDDIREILLPAQPWNAPQEFVSRSRGLIPKSASKHDVAAVVAMVEQYFSEGRNRYAR